MATRKDAYRITALENGLKVLSVFTPQNRQLGVSEISRLTGLPVSTTYRILRTLAAGEFVEQLEDGRFSPGPAVLRLGFSALQNSDVVEAAQGPLKKLQKSTGETCNLGVLVDTDVLYLLRYKTEHYIIGNVSVGSAMPASCTAMGKILLAMLDSDERDRRIERLDLGRSGAGPRARRSVADLQADLVVFRERGWGYQNEEIAHGLRAIAAPVRSMDGVAGAIGVSVEGARWTMERLVDELLDPLLETAQRVSLALGYLDVNPPSRTARRM